MALFKSSTLGNGIDMNYHRISSINNITNITSVIEITSYLDASKREEEKINIKDKKLVNVFTDTKFLNIDYDENLNISKGYDYLKTLNEFKGAEDI